MPIIDRASLSGEEARGFPVPFELIGDFSRAEARVIAHMVGDDNARVAMGLPADGGDPSGLIRDAKRRTPIELVVRRVRI